MLSKGLLSSIALQVRLGACVVVHDGGCKNSDPAVKPGRAQRSMSKKIAAEEEDIPHCTQYPITRSKTSSKRARTQGQGKVGTDAGETTPLTPRVSRSMKVASAFELVDLTLQTPMPASEAGSAFGPPPPETTPAPLREYSPNLIYFNLHIWHQF